MRVLSFPELKSRKGICWSTQWVIDLAKRGLFPAPFKMGDGKTGRNFWDEAEVDAFLAGKAGVRRCTKEVADARASTP
jgi:predicted DNA-binding transcriptional regulator AlpA